MEGWVRGRLKDIYFLQLNIPSLTSKLSSITPTPSSGEICFCQKHREAGAGLFVEKNLLGQNNKAL